MALTRPRIGLLQVVIIALTLFTAGVHFYLALGEDPLTTGLKVLWLLNALGYLAFLAAMYLPLPFFERRRAGLRALFIAYVLATILAWALISLSVNVVEPLDVVTKLDEAALAVALFVESRQLAETGEPIVVSHPDD